MAAGTIGTGGGMGIAIGIGIGTAIVTGTVTVTGIAAEGGMSTLILGLTPMAVTMAGRTGATAVTVGMAAVMVATAVEALATGSKRAIGMDWIEGGKTLAAVGIQLPTTLSTLGMATPHTGKVLPEGIKLAFGSMAAVIDAFDLELP